MPKQQPDPQRRQLGTFLRTRRERLTPDEVGLPRTGRRRTPGLRREELALLAGISATWYTYLEQGRKIRASEQVLHALAAALRLDRHERDHLFHLAGHTPAPEAGHPEPLTAEAAAVPLLLQPHPAYLIAGNYDVLSHNQAAAQLFPHLFSPHPTTEANRPPNLVRWVFLEPAAREVLVDWEPEARALLARLRTLSTHHPDDPRYTHLIDDLHERSPEARTWWPHYELQPRHSGHKRLRHPTRGTVDYHYTAFHLAEQPEQTLVIYFDGSPTTDQAPPPP
ncbi:helix-turn-helix transcriptional regulator [Streptomyces endophytica]|uniref:Helix-turn-helix transcriptional regulator n=1 Tax=Streptomyces endophytica TaxID=2991496 RepID=A0ABY6P8A9_9ACTN|nr:helix-turn-helix transcriptional regulator [Streptomyces endophytica]UZJ29838.1 helix-turn-helix transcriptional regulator [Streptomyces endophytica]